MDGVMSCRCKHLSELSGKLGVNDESHDASL